MHVDVVYECIHVGSVYDVYKCCVVHAHTNLQHEWYGLHLYWSREHIAGCLSVAQEVWRKLMLSGELLKGLHCIRNIGTQDMDPVGIA